MGLSHLSTEEKVKMILDLLVFDAKAENKNETIVGDILLDSEALSQLEEMGYVAESLGDGTSRLRWV